MQTRLGTEEMSDALGFELEGSENDILIECFQVSFLQVTKGGLAHLKGIELSKQVFT